MNRFTIWLDGRAYAGEGEAVEPMPPQSGQWWLRAAASSRNALDGGGEPHVIIGARNLVSHVERILSRVRERHLTFTEMTIRTEPVPALSVREAPTGEKGK